MAFAKSVLLLGMVAACADQPVIPRTADADASAPSLAAGGRSPRDVPEVRIDLPTAPRKWDGNPAALAEAIAAGEGYAVVAFKEPGSGRALATGKRGAVTAGTVRAGLQLLERHGVEVVELLDGIGAARVRITPAAAVELAGHPLVDFVEPRQYGQLQAQSTPWGITMVGAPSFWSTPGFTGAGAKIEIIDTGHQQGHVDLPAVPSANCSGLYGGCNDASTASWHGTHVLGIVAARNNLDGVVGVAPGIAASDVFMYGACTDYGSCPTDEVTAGINAGIWNTHVINMSLSQPYDAAQATAVAQAWASGIVIVAAAGNNMSNTIVYPAAYTNVVGVSGVLSNKAFASTSVCGGAFSNYGSHVDIAAPFEAYSTIGVNTYGTLCGTSMATPHVTGAVALLKSQNPGWTNQQIVDTLYARAQDLGAAGKDVYFGHGLVRPLRPVTPLSVYISGPTTISSAGVYTWYANASGGNGTYSYTWEYREQGGAWVTFYPGGAYARSVATTDPSFEFRVTVTSAGQTAVDTHLVTVTPTPPPPLGVTITGTSYATAGSTGTWSASVTGGNGTYTYQWQFRSATTT
ncbi:MAG TPA: S8 family serine peptidase, partial [Longimicrobium sp.]|nr:S8 family serine peptidase [Longimicrobium sp.]